MKQKIITGLKKKLLLVQREGVLSQDWIDMYSKHEIISKLSDITESQFAELVDKFNHGAYRDYNDKNPFYPDADTDNFFLAARVSFFSKLKADEIYFENPIPHFSHNLNSENKESFWYNLHKSRWQEAESKVWNLSRTYLFEILN